MRPRSRSSTITALAAVALLASSVSALAATAPRWEAPSIAGPNGNPLPRFTLHDTHGRVVSLASLRGHAFLLTILPDGCKTPCRCAATLASIRTKRTRSLPRYIITSTNRARQLPRLAQKLAHNVVAPPARLATLAHAYGVAPPQTTGLLIGVDAHDRWRFAYRTDTLDQSKLTADLDTLYHLR